jgi:two-component system NtrC family sensor kinase
VPLEQQFQALLAGAPDAMIIADAQGRILIANHQAELMFGYSASELIGQPVELLLPADLRALHARHRAGYVGDPHTRPMGSGLDLVARRKDDSSFPVEISLSALHTGDGLLVTSVIRDITERKRAADELERQVQQRTAHLNTLLQVSQELFSARSLDGVLQRSLSHALSLVPEAQLGAIYLYDGATQRLAMRAGAGFSPLPSLSLPIDAVLIGQIFANPQTLQVGSQRELAALLAAQGPEAQEALLRSLELASLPSGLLGVPLRFHDEALGVLLLLRLAGEGALAPEARAAFEGLAHLTAAAISEEQSLATARTLTSRVADLEEQQELMAARLNAAEAGMLQAARLAAVGQLAASIAHEINNPLYAARNCLYLLEADLPAELSATPYLTIARDELGRIAGIIERMRDFYRPPRGELTPCDLNHLIEETLAITSLNTRHVAIHVIFTPARDLPPVIGNGDQLRQVLLNLLLNALDAMPGSGTLTVRTTAGPTMALVEIQDSGVGIPPDVQAHLFEPFFTTKPTGTGLGLSICAHIVTQHGGQIEVESVPGQGSTFRVALPYRPET